MNNGMCLTMQDNDYSPGYVEWEAPTTVQPLTALFATGTSLRNMINRGIQPTVTSGSPVYTPGVAGKTLPSVTLGSNAMMETYQLFTPQMTMVSLLNLGTGFTDILQTPNAGSAPAALAISQRGADMNNFLVCGSGSDQLTENASGLVSGTWQIHAWQCDITTKTHVLNYKNYTTGAAAGGAGSFSAIYTPTDMLQLGGSADQAAASTHEVAVHLFWNSILGTDDMTAAVAWMRLWASGYNFAA